MVASVANPSLASPQSALGRSARVENEATTTAAISTALRREIAVTAKFGPDPETGSPLRIITGDDVQAAETNDLQRLAEVNLGLSSPENAIQAQSSRSEDEFDREGEASIQSFAAAQASFAQAGGSGGDSPAQRGSTVDFQV